MLACAYPLFSTTFPDRSFIFRTSAEFPSFLRRSQGVGGWRIRPDACCRDVCASSAPEGRRHAEERHVRATLAMCAVVKNYAGHLTREQANGVARAFWAALPPLPLFNRGGELDQSLDILPHTERPLPGRCGPLSSLYCWAQSVKRLGGNGSIQHGKSELTRPNGAGWT